MKDAYYFSHDVNAHSDPKIMAMRSVYKAEGYGYYWIVVEMMAEQAEYKLPHKEWLYDALAMRMQCDSNAAAKYVEDCIDKYELFESDGTYFWSNSLCRRMEMKRAAIEKKTEKARKAAQKRWNNSENDAQAMHKQCTSNADAMQNDANKRKGKESKENKSKENESKENESKYVCAEQSAAPSNKGDVFAGRSFSPKMQDKLTEWLKYKAERRESYKPMGLKSFLSEMENKLKQHSEADVIALINECMANNWKGIIWDKIKCRSSPQTENANPFFAAAERMRKGEGYDTG